MWAWQSDLTSTSPSIGIIKASTSSASCNQKKRLAGKKESKYSCTILGPNLEPWLCRKDLDQKGFWKWALFKRSLCVLCLKAGTSRKEACRWCTNKITNATFFWEKPESCEDNNSMMIYSGPVISVRIFLHPLMEQGGPVIDICVNPWGFCSEDTNLMCPDQKLEIAKFFQIFCLWKTGKYLNSL